MSYHEYYQFVGERFEITLLLINVFAFPGVLDFKSCGLDIQLLRVTSALVFLCTSEQKVLFVIKQIIK